MTLDEKSSPPKNRNLLNYDSCLSTQLTLAITNFSELKHKELTINQPDRGTRENICLFATCLLLLL